MVRLIYSWFILFLFTTVVYSQDSFCPYFPLEYGHTWKYQSDQSSDSLVASIRDTVIFKNHLYYRFSLNDEDSAGYWLRPEFKGIQALNTQDSTEYILFKFNAELNESWEIPPVSSSSGNQSENQCDWGHWITKSSDSDTIFNRYRIFFNCSKFTHSGHPCNDPGISVSWFARDFGLLRFTRITDSCAIDWNLVIDKPDTVELSGRYTSVGNPCFTFPCLPGVVAALKSQNKYYVLTKNDRWFAGDFAWYQVVPNLNDSIRVEGVITNRTDLLGNKYSTLEVVNFSIVNLTHVARVAPNCCGKTDRLDQNYPNPFNSQTSIHYFLANAGFVTIFMYDLLGRNVKTILTDFKKPGGYKIVVNCDDLSSGTYFFRMNTANGFLKKSMTLKK